MSKSPVDLDSTIEEYEYDFKLISEDPTILILICAASRQLTPFEYAEALISFAERLKGAGEPQSSTAH